MPQVTQLSICVYRASDPEWGLVRGVLPTGTCSPWGSERKGAGGGSEAIFSRTRDKKGNRLPWLPAHCVVPDKQPHLSEPQAGNKMSHPAECRWPSGRRDDCSCPPPQRSASRRLPQPGNGAPPHPEVRHSQPYTHSTWF